MLNVLKFAVGLLEFLRSRAFAVSLLSLMLALTVYAVTDMVNVVRIQDNGAEVRVCYTLNDNPEEILSDNGIVTLAFDAVDVTSLDGKLSEINVSRAFPVVVNVDGKSKRVMVTGGTVEDAIRRVDIELGKHDLVDADLEEPVEDGSIITITRKEYVTKTDKETLPFETVYHYSPDIKAGSEEILVEGEDGLRERTVRRLIIDGEVVDETVESDEITREPVSEEVVIGFPSKPVSPYNFECEFDENMEPTEYASVMRSQKSAGYSAPAGAYTASGRKAVVGNVAVNPNVIPYGTKMFIKASDGSHIYGYAIAADTGTAIMNGRITVDLLYATYEESCTNGIRNVDIFILED